MKVAKSVIAFLAAFVHADWLSLAVRAFELNGNLRLATKEEDEAISSPHTGTAHNADPTKYIPVRDKRIPDVPLVLRPVTAKKKNVGYVTVIDTAKIANMADCEEYAKIYMAKSLKSKKTFSALNASIFGRQSGEDKRNNYAQNELRKVEERAELMIAAQPYLDLDDNAWLKLRVSVEMRDEALAELIDEMREEAKSANEQTDEQTDDQTNEQPPADPSSGG